MALVPSLGILKLGLGNPLAKAILVRSTRRCQKCGDRRVKLALARYVGERTKFCLTCFIYSSLITLILEVGRIPFSVSKQKMKKYFEDPITRRGLSSILTGIAEHGVTRPQQFGAPFLVVWNFTHACNLRCKHCYERADRPLPDELTTDEAKRLVKELADADVVALAFSGGEPLLRPDFFEIASYARELGLYIAVATNGTTITKHVAEKLNEIGVGYVEISLDGARAETHDEFRGVPGMFDRAVQGIKNCVEAGLYTCVATTATKLNLSETNEIYELVVKLGCKRHTIFNFVPTGRGVEMVELDLSPLERERLLEQAFLNLTSGRGCEAVSTAPQLARVALENARPTEGRAHLVTGHFGSIGYRVEQTRLIAEFVGGCGAGRCYCAIEPNGEVLPCVFMPIKVGNVRGKPFLEIWRDSLVLRDLRDRSGLKGNCSGCQYSYACGGCRARAYGYFGDYHAPDPGCINNMEYWERIRKSQSSLSFNQSKQKI